eukprot:13560855-Alexandrium_andersonii.AAC.1
MASLRSALSVRQRPAMWRRQQGHHSTCQAALGRPAIGPSPATTSRGKPASPGPGHSATGLSAHMVNTMTSG